ncbi:Uncharacterised protein [Mycobacteroides abscessus subsp. abscessus]|nr:Uncharacterised protein [Mycobacteroides abscessus subsp. abscessus]
MQRGALSARRFFHDDGVFVGEAADAADQVDPVALQLGAHHLDLLADDMLGARAELGRGDGGLLASGAGPDDDEIVGRGICCRG